MNFGRYVGIPFLDGGSTHEGCDCWGLVRLVYNENFGITLPEYNDVSSRDLRRVAREMKKGASSDPVWREVCEPRTFDVVLMRVFSGSIVAHVGIAISRDRFLHVERSSHAAIVPFGHPMYRARVAGFRRHEDMA